MNRSLILPVLLLALLVGGPAFSADYQKGLDAYEKKDYATALKEWTPLAEQGDDNAQYRLGYIYRFGKGVPHDYKQAIKWFSLATEQGNADAQYRLGRIHELGLAVPQDYKQAIKWFSLAAEQGHAFAQTMLGSLYGNGLGILQDYTYAHMWFNIAASNGSNKAAKYRRLLVPLMSPTEISTARRLAHECVAKNYKGC